MIHAFPVARWGTIQRPRAAAFFGAIPRDAMFRFVIALLLTLTLLSGCGGGNEDNGNSIADAIRIVEEYGCTNEYEKALELNTIYIDIGFGRLLPFIRAEPLPWLWDGTPFVVDISSTFTNADRLLEVVAEEAERIHAVLGYEIFVAGEVLRLADVTESQLINPDFAFQIPPDQHIEILCCYGPDPQVAGIASPGFRVVVLRNDAFWSRYTIIHELYHLLGFVHPGETEGVVMSEELMYGPGEIDEGRSFPTQSTPIDLAKLACIYD